MYWIEVGSDGSYVAGGVEYPIQADRIELQESYDGERSGDTWAKTITPFVIETPHGEFHWEVEIIEYLEMGVASLLGYAITGFPSGVLLKDEVVFRLQDGWEYPSKSNTIDLKQKNAPRLKKIHT